MSDLSSRYQRAAQDALDVALVRSAHDRCGLCGESKSVEPLPGVPGVLRCTDIGQCRWPAEAIIGLWSDIQSGRLKRIR